MRRVLAYFGLDGSATRDEWIEATVVWLPPNVGGNILSKLVAPLIGAHGLAQWALWMLFGVLIGVVWVPLSGLWVLRRRRNRGDWPPPPQH